MSENLQLMKDARRSLDPYWVTAVLITLVYALISGGISAIEGIIGTLLSFLISPPLTLGLAIFALKVARDQKPEFADLFQGFNQLGKVLIVYLIMVPLIIIGLVLLIVPGIIISLGLAMTLFILADNPDISATDALQKSWDMMRERKGKLFFLSLRFIPWYVLGMLLLFVGLLFVIPWAYVANAKFYEELKAQLPESESNPIL